MSTFKQAEDMAKQGAEYVQNKIQEALPKVSFNKNGYEIRTQVLEMAKGFEEFQFGSKFSGWEQSVRRDPNTGEVVTTVAMPAVPGVDQVLETAEKFYNFINKSK
jgi:hypothetical protein